MIIAHVMWKADPNAGTSAVVHWSNVYGSEVRRESGEEPFDDSDTWGPGLTFRVPAGHHWIRVGASWKNGANETDCSDMEAKSQANVKGAPTVTYTTTEPDPAIITPLGRTVNLNSKGQAAVAIVACPFDGAGACSVKLPGTTTVSVGGKKYHAVGHRKEHRGTGQGCQGLRQRAQAGAKGTRRSDDPPRGPHHCDQAGHQAHATHRELTLDQDPLTTSARTGSDSPTIYRSSSRHRISTSPSSRLPLSHL